MGLKRKTNLKKCYEGHKALQLAKQQWEVQRQLGAEASTIAAQTSTQLNAEFCMLEYDTSAEMDELKDNATLRKLEKISEGGNLVDHLESQLQNPSSESSTQNSVCEAVEYERH